ncbi:MAG: hypothetical protein L6311_10115, partial [Cellulomonas sp.]|nr:hypothetical protein [Cellulomonas sp.]
DPSAYRERPPVHLDAHRPGWPVALGVATGAAWWIAPPLGVGAVVASACVLVLLGRRSTRRRLH